MPLSKSGKFFMDPKRARMADEMDGPDLRAGQDEPQSVKMTELHDHGDGTYHTESGGEREEHGDLDSALECLREKHADTNEQGTQMQ